MTESELISDITELARTCDGFNFEAIERAIPLAKEKLKRDLEFQDKAKEFNEKIMELLNAFLNENKATVANVQWRDGGFRFLSH